MTISVYAFLMQSWNMQTLYEDMVCMLISTPGHIDFSGTKQILFSVKLK
jgi:peptide subunit release factor RF-3